MLNAINNISSLFKGNVQQSSPNPLLGTSMDWYKNQNANNSVLAPGANPFKVNDMFNKPLHKSIGNPTGFSLQDNPLSKSLASGKTGFLGGLKNIGGGIGDFTKTAGLTSTGGIAGVGELAYGITDSFIKKPDMMGVEDQIVSGVAKGAWKVAGLAPNPYTIGAAAVLSGFDIANKSFGKSLNSDGTQDMANTGYDNFSADDLLKEGGKGKKGTLWSRWFHKNRTKAQNARIDFGRDANLLASDASYLNKQNTLASQNTTGVLQDRTDWQLRGGADTRMLAARMGTKIPPVNLRKIVNKAYYNFEQKNKFKDPILGQKGSKTLPPPSKRTSVRKNEDGTESTHLYASGESDGKFVAYPTIYQNDKGEYYEAENAFEEAIKKGEIIEFDTDEEAKVYAEGAWKNHYNYDGTPKKYKDGGLLTKSDKEEVIEEIVEEKKNVIPEGAFHSRKNNIHKDVSEHVTHKGIPVITKDEEGKVTQHAEVERNEIIFHKEATDTMETLYKKYNEAETQKLKDEIAIECGKYIADQILVNTDDRTGIIETIE